MLHLQQYSRKVSGLTLKTEVLEFCSKRKVSGLILKTEVLEFCSKRKVSVLTSKCQSSVLNEVFRLTLKYQSSVLKERLWTDLEVSEFYSKGTSLD